jgi:hypothetical protein
MKKTGKLVYWTPRILSILFICYLSLFSLDVYEPGMSAGDVALGMFMHNIPSLIMIVLLVIAWRKEIVGAISFIGAGLLYIGLVGFNVVNSELPWYIAITWGLTIAGPAFLIGILYLINWQKDKLTKYNNT